MDLRVVLNPVTGALICRGRDTQRHTKEESHVRREAGRDWSYAVISQGAPGVTKS